MTATKSAPGGSPPTTGIFTPRRGNPRRRSPAMVSIGVILVVLGALGAWRFVGVAAAGTHPYIAVFKPVPIGATITADDLQVVKITSAAGLNPIPADEAREVIGKHAKVQLVPGTLLTPDELTDAGSPSNGQALVGLQLKPNQRPSRTLRPGEKVTLIETPDPSATNADPSSAPTWPATVLDVAKAADDGTQVVDVIVDASNVSPIATMGNAGRIVAVLVPGS
jgi:SAF domain